MPRPIARNALVLLGAWIAAAALLFKVGLWMGGSAALLQWLRPDGMLAAFSFRMSDFPAALSIVNGAALILAGRSWRAPRLFPAAVLALLCLLVSLLAMEVAALRLSRQIAGQWGWTDEQKRADWMAHQGFDYGAVQRCRGAIAPADRVLVLADGDESSLTATAFLGFYLMPRRLYACRAWGPPPSTYDVFLPLRRVPPGVWRRRGIDWLVVIRRGRIESCRRFEGGRLP